MAKKKNWVNPVLAAQKKLHGRILPSSGVVIVLVHEDDLEDLMQEEAVPAVVEAPVKAPETDVSALNIPFPVNRTLH